MSLINDALKKASQTSTPAAPAQIKEPLRVATHTPRPRWPMFVVPPLVALVFATGTMLVVRGWQGSGKVSARESAPAESSQVLIKDQYSAPNEVAAVNSASPPPTVAAPPQSPARPTNVAAAAPVLPTFPALRLQGIFWRPTRPSVLINNKTLYVGDKVEKAVIKAIDQESVTLLWNGEQRVLTLP